ncbi:unnamed protein product [Anisakis simplex]|uniref:CNNM transmembrane domain-containing protein n=1 Tax=Anisakis simplex TaxID=6269 RepID=A0A0M3JZ55_ANISI|nr:unnamed protein product [Anisakis simplex]
MTLIVAVAIMITLPRMTATILLAEIFRLKNVVKTVFIPLWKHPEKAALNVKPIQATVTRKLVAISTEEVNRHIDRRD